MTSDPGKGIFLRRKVYWLRFTANGKQQFVSLQTGDPVEAASRAIKARASNEFAPKTDLETDIDRFVASKKRRGKFTSVETEKWARRGLKHLVTFFPRKTARSITARDMESFGGSLLASQAETGAMSYLRGIKSFFSWCVDERIRFDNPCRKLVRVPREAARTRFATKAQRDALIAGCESLRTDPDDHARGRYHAALHFALYCAFHAGMRYNEIVQARADWFHFDGNRSYIEIQNTTSFQTKNRRGRIVPLSRPFREFLWLHYGTPEPFMIAPHKSQGKNSYRYDFRKPWREHVAAHGVAWITPHTARHTFASLLVQSDTSIFKVAKWMGHGVSVCERHYAHLSPGDTGIDKML